MDERPGQGPVLPALIRTRLCVRMIHGQVVVGKATACDRPDGRGVKLMIVGVPKEIKPDEYRVAMLPVGAEELTTDGHTVLIETGAGLGSGITDAQYASAGAIVVGHAAEIWSRADLVVKVK